MTRCDWPRFIAAKGKSCCLTATTSAAQHHNPTQTGPRQLLDLTHYVVDPHVRAPTSTSTALPAVVSTSTAPRSTITPVGWRSTAAARTCRNSSRAAGIDTAGHRHGHRLPHPGHEHRHRRTRAQRIVRRLGHRPIVPDPPPGDGGAARNDVRPEACSGASACSGARRCSRAVSPSSRGDVRRADRRITPSTGVGPRDDARTTARLVRVGVRSAPGVPVIGDRCRSRPRTARR